MFRVEPDRGMQKNYTGWSDNSEIAHIDQKVFEELGIKRPWGQNDSSKPQDAGV